MTVYNNRRVAPLLRGIVVTHLVLYLMIYVFNMFRASPVGALTLFVDHLRWFPILALFCFYITRIMGFAFDDKEVALVQRKKSKWKTLGSVKWEDVTKVEYKKATVKLLYSSKLIVSSGHDNFKIVIDDSYKDFQKMLTIVREKTNMDIKRS